MSRGQGPLPCCFLGNMVKLNSVMSGSHGARLVCLTHQKGKRWDADGAPELCRSTYPSVACWPPSGSPMLCHNQPASKLKPFQIAFLIPTEESRYIKLDGSRRLAQMHNPRPQGHELDMTNSPCCKAMLGGNFASNVSKEVYNPPIVSHLGVVGPVHGKVDPGLVLRLDVAQPAPALP